MASRTGARDLRPRSCEPLRDQSEQRSPVQARARCATESDPATQRLRHRPANARGRGWARRFAQEPGAQAPRHADQGFLRTSSQDAVSDLPSGAGAVRCACFVFPDEGGSALSQGGEVNLDARPGLNGDALIPLILCCEHPFI